MTVPCISILYYTMYTLIAPYTVLFFLVYSCLETITNPETVTLASSSGNANQKKKRFI